jgi:phenylacetate-CoA ligase
MNGKKFWDRFEKLSPKELEKLQTKRLKNIVSYVYQHNALYRKKLKALHLTPSDIKTLNDLKKLPFLSKEDLMNSYPFGFLCTPLEKVIEIHSTSGTTGKPIIIPYSFNDIKLWTQIMARALWANGVRKGDIVFNALGYGLFTGAHGHERGAQAIGATVVPVGTKNPYQQILLMKELQPTVITSTPSFIMYLAEVAIENGLDPSKDFGLRLASLGAESWSENLRKRIEETWNIVARETYGLSEIIGPCTSFECEKRSGLHVHADVFYPEIIDPKTGEQLGVEEKGELVFTTLVKEAFPLIRFRTGDLAYLIDGDCECGRTLPRHSRIIGRIDDAIKVKGVLVFPTQIENALLQIKELNENFEIIEYKKNFTTYLKVRVESRKRSKKFAEKIKSHLRGVLGVNVDVELLKPHTLERKEGKRKILKRKLKN